MPDQTLISIKVCSHVITKDVAVPVVKFNVPGDSILPIKGFDLSNYTWQHGVLRPFLSLMTKPVFNIIHFYDPWRFPVFPKQIVGVVPGYILLIMSRS